MTENPIGWIAVKKTGDRFTTGNWGGRSQKLYISENKAKAAVKLSDYKNTTPVDVIPVYTNSTTTESLGLKILKAPMGENDAGAKTIGEYLIKLSHECWAQEDGFSGKRPFGNSGWVHEIYNALADTFPKEIKAVWYDIAEDEDESYRELESFDMKAANKMISTAYQALYEVVKL